jgi:hypothetical protein
VTTSPRLKKRPAPVAARKPKTDKNFARERFRNYQVLSNGNDVTDGGSDRAQN